MELILFGYNEDATPHKHVFLIHKQLYVYMGTSVFGVKKMS